MRNLQHIIDRMPALEREGRYEEYEKLSQDLYNSGLLRVDTGHNSNFARWVDATRNVSIMISKEELSDKLIEKTKEKLRKKYKNEGRINQIIDNCNKQIEKLQPVSDEIRIKLCRLLTQSTRAIVIHWILLENVEIFVSYANDIGDMMDINTWKHAGKNSGMQSTDGREVAVFVSCGGNPFGTTDPELKIYGDGWPALARLQIIAGQELGHYADIRRDKLGRQIGRHSANFACTRPTPHVKEARHKDIARCKQIRTYLMENGMDRLIHYNSSLRFYHKNKVTGIRTWFSKLMGLYYRRKLCSISENDGYFFIKKFKREQYMGLMIEAMIEDMLANLTPNADVYKRDDKDAEEAIACAEALARVPQQAVKWGYITTSTMMAGLYEVYYEEVIPNLIEVYENVTGKKYKPNYNKIPLSFKTKVKRFMAKFKKQDLPYRDLDK